MPEPAASLVAGGAQSEAFAAYVSPLLIERIACDRPVFGQPFAAEFEGAVLFSDITGFTGLTERIEASGPDGVERLSGQLNACFSRLIQIVDEHGGTVVKFAGDALLAVWPAEEVCLEEAARCAANCARAIVTAPTAEASFAVKASVGAGGVVHAIFGGTGGRWVSMIGGAATEAARAAMTRCRVGEVALPPARSVGVGAAMVTARPKRLRVLPGDEWLHAHLPTAVLDRIAADQMGWMAEFRRVSVLFIQVLGVELRAASDLEVVQRALVTIQAEVARCGGSIDDTGEDHSALVVVAAFGLPGATHGDDAARATRAALGIVAASRGAGLRAGIGVGTGRLFCGAIGSAAVRSYSMVGDAMNRGARLMRLAHDEVLCDDETRRSAARHLHFEFLRHEVLQGRRGTVAIHRPSERRWQAPAAGGLIGRDAERHLFRERLASLASSGIGGVIILEGEAGIGKSALLAELRAVARSSGVAFYQGGAEAIDAASTYHAWQPVFHELVGITAGMDARARATALLGMLAAKEVAEPPLAPLLNPIFGTHLPENAITAEMAAQSRAEAVTRMLVQLLGQAAVAAPLVVAVEDCHWLDSASLALALALLRSVPRFLLVLVTRPLGADEPETWAALRAVAGSERLRLGPLLSAETVMLARRRLGVPQLDPALVRLVGERSGGNPFFTEELCHALRDSGHLRIAGGRCRLERGSSDEGPLDLPDTVQGVVSARIDRLSARERLAIKVASVNGRAFTLRMLESVHPVEADRPHLGECVKRLVALDFAAPLVTPEGETFEFKHSIVQEVAYGQLTFSQRRRLHQRVAEWIEREKPDEDALLARHWSEAEVPERALHYLDRAGGEAIRRFANREAAGFLMRAITLARSSGATVDRLTQGRWHRQLGEARFHLGRLPECRRDLTEGARLLGWPVPGGALALPVAIGRQFARRVWPRPPRPCEPGQREGLIEALHCYQLLGEVAYFTNDLATCGFCIFHGANLAESLGPSPALARLYGGIAVLAGMASEHLGEAYLRRATRAVEACDHPLTTAYSGIVTAIYLGGFGACRRLQPPLRTGCEIFRRYGDGRRLEESLIHLIYTHLHCGDYAACARLLEEMGTSAESRDDTQTRGWVRLLRALVALPTDGPHAAIEILGGDYETGLDALTVTAMHATAGIARWRLGDAERARRHALAAFARNEQQPPKSYVMLLYIGWVAEVFLELVQHAPAESPRRRSDADLARRACAALRRFARFFPVARARAALCDGRWQAIRGRRAAAKRCWWRALEAAERFELLPEQAMAHGFLGQWGDEAHRTAAAAIWERLGARAELDSWRSSAHRIFPPGTRSQIL